MVEKNSRISVRYDIAGALREAGALLPSQPAKRLRRLPHLFCRLLELPVGADSPVQVQESPSSFIFKVTLPPPLPQIDHIRAQIVQIVPGVTKVCVVGAQIATALLDELDIPLWRFRLPASSLPEASTAYCNDDGLLVLTIPKTQEAPPSLLQPYQVTLKRTPSLDADPELAMHSDGLSESGVSSFVASASASLQGFTSSSPSMGHNELSSQGVATVEKEIVSDVKEQDAIAPDVKEHDASSTG